MSASLLASVGASLDSLDDGEAAAAAGLAGASSSGAGQLYTSFDEGDGSFLMALRQSKRKSIRQARARALARLRAEGLGRSSDAARRRCPAGAPSRGSVSQPACPLPAPHPTGRRSGKRRGQRGCASGA